MSLGDFKILYLSAVGSKYENSTSSIGKFPWNLGITVKYFDTEPLIPDKFVFIDSSLSGSKSSIELGTNILGKSNNLRFPLPLTFNSA